MGLLGFAGRSVAFTAVFGTLAYLVYIRLYVLHFRHSRDFNSVDDRQNELQMIIEGLDVISRNREALIKFQTDMYSSTLGGNPPLKNKIVLLTGATKGLGRGIASHLAAWGAKLVLPCRRCNQAQFKEQVRSDAHAVLTRYGKNKNDKLLSTYFVEPLVFDVDLADLDQIDALVDWYSSQKLGPVDYLINNAGLFAVFAERTKQGFETTFGVNFLASAYLTDKLLKLGLVREKIAAISSEGHRSSSTIMEQLRHSNIKFGQFWGVGVSDMFERYGWSKLAQTTYFQGLMRRTDVPIVELCPGPVASDIAINAVWPLNVLVKAVLDLIFVSTEEAAIPVLRLVLDPSFKGKHFHIAEERPPRGDARDPAFQDQLLAWTDDLIRNKRPPQ